MPWLTPGEHTLVDLLDADAQVVLVEPRRMRDRAAEILAEEADLAGSLSKTWGAEGTEFPRLHAPFDDLLANTPARRVDVPPHGRPSRHAVVEATGWGPVVGDGEGLGRRIAELLGERYRVVVAADTDGSAQRLHDLLLSVSLDLTVDLTSATDLTAPAATSSSPRSITGSCCPRPDSRSSPRPTSPAGDARTAGRGRSVATRSRSSKT